MFVSKTKTMLTNSGVLLSLFHYTHHSSVASSSALVHLIESCCLDCDRMAPLKDPDWDTYRVWELRAVRQFPPPEKHVPRKTLIDKALAEWQRKSRQTEYADIVRALQKAEVEAGKADKKIYTIPKKLKAGNDALADAQRKRHQTLVASRKAWQAVITLLRDLRTEQEETDNNGDVIANKRAIDYTNYLDEQARARVAALEQSIKQSREARGSKLAAVSESEDQPDVEGNEVQATVQAAENGQTGASGDAATTGGQKSPSKGSQRSSGKRSASQLDEPGADSRLSEAQRPRKSTRRSSTAQSGPSDRNESGGALTNGNTSSMPAGAELNEDSDALRVGKNFVASWDAIEMLGPPDSEGSSRWRDELASLRDRATKLFEDKDVKIVPQLSKNTLGKVLANVQARIKEAETHTTALSQATLLSNASALPMQTKDFYARWNELLELAKSTGKYTEEWDKKIRARCPIAARLLINNGAVIVPEIRDDTDPIQELEDLAEMIKRVQAENGENSRKREKLRKDKYKSSKELGFADSGGASPFRGEFVFWKVIEVGGTSAPALWVCHDEDGHIIDRVAVKDVWVPDNEWSTRLPWVGEVDERKPREGTMHRVVSRTNSEYVVQYRAHAVMFREKVLRSYMELCRYGEFWDMWCDQMGDWQHEVRFSDRYLCVPAIWAFFECLAKAAHVMTFGCLPERAEPADWEGILHRDIKANNGTSSSSMLMAPSTDTCISFHDRSR